MDNNNMKEDIKELKNDIKEVKGAVKSIDGTLIKQEENLKHHMFRTELAEKRLEHIENGLEPIKKHVNGMNGVLKALGVLAIILGILKTTGVI